MAWSSLVAAVPTPGPIDQSAAGVSAFRDLVLTDTEYFGADAEIVHDVLGTRITVMSGLEDLAAGCLAPAFDSVAAEADPRMWRQAFESAVRAVGGGQFRLYVDAPAPNLVAHLLAHDYLMREEVILLRDGPAKAPENLRLVEVEDSIAWAAKVQLDAVGGTQPDGHSYRADRWAEFEHRKWRSGALRYFIAELDGRPVATMGSMQRGDLIRVKNLVVHPDFRRQGVAGQVCDALQAFFQPTASRCGVFAVAGDAGHRMYERNGFRVIGSVLELHRQSDSFDE